MSSSRFHLFLLLASLVASIHGQEFMFSEHLKLDGATEIMPNGSAMAINSTGLRKGQVFYAQPFKFKPSEMSNTLFSFSTSFVFSLNIETRLVESNQEGLCFVISSSKWLPLYSMVLEEESKLEEPSLIMINFKTSRNSRGMENGFLEININGAPKMKHSPLDYYRQSSDELRKVRLTRGQLTQVWLDYDGEKRELNVTIAPVSSSASRRPSFSFPLDIKPHIYENMFVGISLSTSWHIKPLSSNHYLLGWSMKMNGKAEDFDLTGILNFTENDEVFGNQITRSIGGFDPQNLGTFPCLSCLVKYLHMMNCTTEQIEVLEGQCLTMVWQNHTAELA